MTLTSRSRSKTSQSAAGASTSSGRGMLTRRRRDAMESERFTEARLESLNTTPPSRTRAAARKVTSPAGQGASSPTKAQRKPTKVKVEPDLTTSSPLRAPAVTALTPTRTLRSGRSVGEAILIDDDSPVRRVTRAAPVQTTPARAESNSDEDCDPAVTRSRLQRLHSARQTSPTKRPMTSATTSSASKNTAAISYGVSSPKKPRRSEVTKTPEMPSTSSAQPTSDKNDVTDADAMTSATRKNTRSGDTKTNCVQINLKL